ncbi:hypothetical protein F5Y03DRAFT_213200 [Xylaria venustula]|nr:hypothetical protein F5Y03DRAFT_213200 [Xylaria venustula]
MVRNIWESPCSKPILIWSALAPKKKKSSSQNSPLFSLIMSATVAAGPLIGVGTNAATRLYDKNLNYKGDIERSEHVLAELKDAIDYGKAHRREFPSEYAPGSGADYDQYLETAENVFAEETADLERDKKRGRALYVVRPGSRQRRSRSDSRVQTAVAKIGKKESSHKSRVDSRASQRSRRSAAGTDGHDSDGGSDREARRLNAPSHRSTHQTPSNGTRRDRHHFDRTSPTDSQTRGRASSENGHSNREAPTRTTHIDRGDREVNKYNNSSRERRRGARKLASRPKQPRDDRNAITSSSQARPMDTTSDVGVGDNTHRSQSATRQPSTDNTVQEPRQDVTRAVPTNRTARPQPVATTRERSQRTRGDPLYKHPRAIKSERVRAVRTSTRNNN